MAKEKSILCIFHPGPGNPSSGKVSIKSPRSDTVLEYNKPTKLHPSIVAQVRKGFPFRVLPSGTKIGLEILPDPRPPVLPLPALKLADPEPKSRAQESRRKLKMAILAKSKSKKQKSQKE